VFEKGAVVAQLSQAERFSFRTGYGGNVTAQEIRIRSWIESKRIRISLKLRLTT
jgi:hypothetical protein